jgi:alpha-D-ribose 1-methylphosphonate 5-triphosphate synthase subunit PhnG
MGFDNAMENAIEGGFGGLFGGATITGLIGIISGTTITAASILVSPITGVFVLAALGYGFMRGRRKDKAEEAKESAS